MAQGMAKFEGIMAAYKLSLRDEHCIYSRVRAIMACAAALLDTNRACSGSPHVVVWKSLLHQDAETGSQLEPIV